MAEVIVDYTPEEMIETIAELAVEKIRSQPAKRYYDLRHALNDDDYVNNSFLWFDWED